MGAKRKTAVEHRVVREGRKLPGGSAPALAPRSGARAEEKFWEGSRSGSQNFKRPRSQFFCLKMTLGNLNFEKISFPAFPLIFSHLFSFGGSCSLTRMICVMIDDAHLFSVNILEILLIIYQNIFEFRCTIGNLDAQLAI